MTHFSKILCVIDPTQNAQPALARASWLAESSGAEVNLLVCYYDQYLSGDRFFDSMSLRKARRETLDRYERKLKALAAPLREDGIAVTTTVVWDHPLHEGIVRQAVALNADVVFKDTHHHSALSVTLFTNTDWSLIRACPVPLWLVTPARLHSKPTIVAAIDPFNEHDKPAALDDQILSISKTVAQNVDGDIHAFHAFNPSLPISTTPADGFVPMPIPTAEFEQEIRERHENRFKEVTDYHEIPSDHAHLIAGMTHIELPEFAEKAEADVVVMGAVARNRLQRLFIGATAERTLGHLPCDLLVIKPDWFQTPVDTQIRDVA